MVLVHKEAREKKHRGEERGSEKQGRWGTGGEQERKERARPSSTQPSTRRRPPSAPPRPATRRPFPRRRRGAPCARLAACVRVPRRYRRACVAGPGRGGSPPPPVGGPPVGGNGGGGGGGGPGRLLEVEKCLLSWGRRGGRGASAVASVTGGRLPVPGGCCHVGGRCGALPVPLRAPPRRRPLRYGANCAPRRRTAPRK